jgi:hypothetical protein
MQTNNMRQFGAVVMAGQLVCADNRIGRIAIIIGVRRKLP